MTIADYLYGSLQAYLVVSFLLFVLGFSIVLLRRSLLIQFMGVELMLNAANLALLAFARWRGDISGSVLYLFIIAVAACEAAVGLALIIGLFRHRGSTDTDGADALRQ